jgi:hypothetical protein
MERLKLIDESAKKADDVVESAKTAKKLIDDSRQPSVPVYEVRAGKGRFEVWIVGHQTADGAVAADPPQLVRSMEVPYTPAEQRMGGLGTYTVPSSLTGSGATANPRTTGCPTPGAPLTCNGGGACRVR